MQPFLRLMSKNSFKRMNLLGLNENYPASDFIDWRYIITNKNLYQIANFASLEYFQQQQQQKFHSYSFVLLKFKEIIKLLTFQTTTNKRLGRKLPSLLERVKTVDLRRLIS